MTMNVFDLAQQDTRLTQVARYASKGNGPEYAGPCPRCKGTDRFHVQPDRKEGGAWMCRNCWPAESKGWGDNREYLKQFRGMKDTAAQSFLAGKVETAIERVEQAHNKKLEQYGRHPNQTWQDRATGYAEQAQSRLWTPEGQAGLDYLRSRGIMDKTIEAACLGYALYPVRLASGERRSLPCIVIPWHTGGVYWRITLLNMSRGPGEAKYYNVPGSSNAGLYAGDLLTGSKPVFLVEGELDCLSILQECSDLVTCVATGTTTGSRTDKWVARLAMSPAVLVAYDNDSEGDQAAKDYWLRVLEHNAIRYRPILYNDANAMLVADKELVRSWVLAALDYVSSDQDAGSQSVQAALSTQNTFVDPEHGFTCSICGIDLNDIDTACYSPDGAPFCDYDENKQAYCSRGHVRTQPETYEQFMSYVNQLAAGLNEQTDTHWTVTPVEPGYTLKQHVHEIEQRAAEDYKRAMRNGHIQAG